MKKYLFTACLLLLAGTSLFAQITPDTSFYVKNNKNIYSIVIAKGNKTVCEQYYNGKTNHTLMNEQSLTKSVVSLLIGIAIDKHFISSLDDPIGKYFPQLATDKDPRKQSVTIRQIMNQASGLWHEDVNNLNGYLNQKDPSGYVLKQNLLADPGANFYYSNAASHLLSVILTKATNMPTLDFANKYLFGPMEITDVNWVKMNDGFYDGSGLLSLRMLSRDMLKIGQLVLNNGFYVNKRLVSAVWIKSIFNPANTYNTEWGFTGSNYALCWYHFNYQGNNITYALGWGGQFLVIIPKYRAVIVVNSSIANDDAIMESAKFTTKIFPVLYEDIKRLK